ncbi:hypothetical protein SAMN02910292_02548 [Lachnospiraceae bacterium XBB2008]|nr:hypothetical protein SAMN02910292_02548 [Lachnospiraceae bacterium XBB2008]
MSDMNLSVEEKLYMIKDLADAIISLSISSQVNENLEVKPTLNGMCAIGEMIRREADEAIKMHVQKKSQK